MEQVWSGDSGRSLDLSLSFLSRTDRLVIMMFFLFSFWVIAGSAQVFLVVMLRGPHCQGPTPGMQGMGSSPLSHLPEQGFLSDVLGLSGRNPSTHT